jgi:copper homeostasis protein (lipoprotein)
MAGWLGCLIALAVARGAAAAELGPLPAHFAGEAAGTAYRLDLLPEQAFFLRRAAPGDAPTFDVGSFLVLADRQRLVLWAEREAPLELAVEGPEQLRLPDGALLWQADLAPLEPRLALRGMYRYFADAGLFTECSTRLRLPVAQEADNAALERAYGELRRQPGEELLVTLEGQIAARPKMEGSGTELALVPERLIGVWPGETCGARFETAPLENSYWKLTRLGAAPVLVGAGQREPFLILRPDGQRLGGFGGCNALAGGYRLDGEKLELGPVASTMMACPDGMDTEAAFAAALAQVRSWRVQGEHLELFDAAGTLLARLERRLMP